MGRSIAIAASAASLLLAACAGPGLGLTGNDTGGIIPWSPVNKAYFQDAAAQHCLQYAKVAKITGVDAQYGGYVSFSCFPSRRLLYG